VSVLRLLRRVAATALDGRLDLRHAMAPRRSCAWAYRSAPPPGLLRQRTTETLGGRIPRGWPSEIGSHPPGAGPGDPRHPPDGGRPFLPPLGLRRVRAGQTASSSSSPCSSSGRSSSRGSEKQQDRPRQREPALDSRLGAMMHRRAPTGAPLDHLVHTPVRDRCGAKAVQVGQSSGTASGDSLVRPVSKLLADAWANLPALTLIAD
jgi:hypothetical protein